jgi:hypothetical protein
LAALVGIEDLGPAIARERFLRSAGRCAEAKSQQIL